MAKDTFYFPHDYGARNDPKLQKLQMTMGHEGKGIFWDLLELMYEQGGYLPITECESIAFALRTSCDKLNAVLQNYNLFKKSDTHYYSESVIARLNLRKSKSEKASESANKRWKNANAMRTHSEGNAIKERKVKESKGKERKENKEKGIKKLHPIVNFSPPSENDVKKYFVENGYTEQAAVTAFRYYSTANWVDSKGNKVRNWKQKMISVWFKPENKHALQAERRLNH